jgi:hypothetical protein
MDTKITIIVESGRRSVSEAGTESWAEDYCFDSTVHLITSRYLDEAHIAEVEKQGRHALRKLIDVVVRRSKGE